MPDVPTSQPSSNLLVDRYDRVARDLRISLTDRCNLRCTYCLPQTPEHWLADDQLLSLDEFTRLIDIAVNQLGIRSIRFTGGEPLLYHGLTRLIAHASNLIADNGSAVEVALTTNALGLKHKAKLLAQAGLQRINISLDSIDEQVYAKITQRNRLADVLAGIEAARDAGLRPIKINCVPQPDSYRQSAVELLNYCLAGGYQLRFIENMPLSATSWRADQVVTRANLLDAIRAAGAKISATNSRGKAPAELFEVELGGNHGFFGIVASVTAPFCVACDRTRLTADGQVRSCLFSDQETDLRRLLRAGAPDEEIAQAWRAAMWAKPRAHGIDNPGFAPVRRTMSAIGG